MSRSAPHTHPAYKYDIHICTYESVSYRYPGKPARPPASTQLPVKIFITLFYARSAAVSVAPSS